MFTRDNILLECDTELEHYQVIDMVYEGRRSRVLFSGKRDAAFSGMPLDDNHDLLFDYVQRMYELAAGLCPKRMLLIGGGTYTLPTALLHTLSDIEIDSIEIDPQLEVIAGEYFNLKPNPRHRIFHTDGKSYLENTDQKYDLILIDAFSHLEIPESLADATFANLVHEHLNKNGRVALNIISSYRGRRSDTIKHFYNLYSNRFPHTSVHPACNNTSMWSSQNFVLIAEKDEICASDFMRYPALKPPDTSQ